MIIDSIITGLKNLILWFVDLLPSIDIDTSFLTSSTFNVLVDIKNIFNYFLGSPIATFLIASFLTMIVAYPLASTIKFIYKKIPGVS